MANSMTANGEPVEPVSIIRDWKKKIKKTKCVKKNKIMSYWVYNVILSKLWKCLTLLHRRSENQINNRSHDLCVNSQCDVGLLCMQLGDEI